MAIPRQVQYQVRKATELHGELYGKTGEAEAPAAPEPRDGFTAAPEPGVSAPTPEDAPEGGSPEPAALPAEAWEHRFRVLQGKYNAEVPRLHAQLSAAHEELGGARERLESLQVRHQAQTEETFYADLARLVPDWAEVNGNQGFLLWLGGTDPLTGRVRQELLDAAQEGFDARRAAQFFVAWKGQAPRPAQQRADLQRQVVPPRSRGGAEMPQGKRAYAQDEIRSFYQERAMGRYRGREDEARRIEQDIFAAQREGRIR